MRILSNSSVALAGVLALAPCIPAANGQTFPAGVTPVRGAVTAVTANSVTVQTPQGPVFVQLVQPVKVFTRIPSDLGHITNKTFVGVTSAKGADGKEHATEVHIFPEELRDLLLDPSISDLMINGSNGVFADRNGVLQCIPLETL